MPCPGGRLPQRADRNDDPQPHVGAVLVALVPHCLDHLARLRRRVLTVLLNPEVSRAVNVEVGDWHGRTIAERATVG